APEEAGLKNDGPLGEKPVEEGFVAGNRPGLEDVVFRDYAVAVEGKLDPWAVADVGVLLLHGVGLHFEFVERSEIVAIHKLDIIAASGLKTGIAGGSGTLVSLAE